MCGRARTCCSKPQQPWSHSHSHTQLWENTNPRRLAKQNVAHTCDASMIVRSRALLPNDSESSSFVASASRYKIRLPVVVFRKNSASKLNPVQAYHCNIVKTCQRRKRFQDNSWLCPTNTTHPRRHVVPGWNAPVHGLVHWIQVRAESAQNSLWPGHQSRVSQLFGAAACQKGSDVGILEDGDQMVRRMSQRHD